MTNRRNFIKQAFVYGTGAMLVPSFAFKSDDLVKLVIVHTNDMHCHFEPFDLADPRFPGKGGMNRIAAYVRQLRELEPELILLDSGDFSQGTPYYNFFKGEVVMKLMSAMRYDASTMGNHEFDNGLDGFLNTLKFGNFPIVCSNYDFSKTILKDKIPQNIILERKGIRIGIYGLGIELDGLVQGFNFEGVVYFDPLKAAQEQEEYLRKKGNCDFIICLSHLGYSYKQEKVCDLDLATNTSYTDLILGGHTHTFLDAPVEKPNKRGEPVVINQVGWGTLMMGYMEFYFEKSKKKQSNKAINKSIG